MELFNSDNNAKLKAALPYIRNVYTSLFGSVTALLFANVIYVGYLATYLGYEADLNIPVKILLVALLPISIIALAALVYNYFDNVDLFAKREYFESEYKKPLLKQLPHITGFGISMLFSTLIFTSSFHTALSAFFPDVNIAVARFLAVATMAAMRLFQIWSLQDKWQAEIENPLFVEKALFKRNQDMYAFKPHQLILQPIGYFFAFGALWIFVSNMAFPALIFPFIITAANFVLTPDLWWTTLSIPLIIFAIWLSATFAHNATKRRILFKRLKQIEREGLGRVEISGSKYLSSTFVFLPLTVKLTDRQGEVYNCTVATCGEINAPMFFKSDEYIVEHGFHLRGGGLLSKGGRFGRVVDISEIGGKENPTNMIFGFRSSHKLSFPDIEGHKTVILNPTPTTAYSVEGHEYRPIDTGENMQNYTIYTATGLFNHIERQSRKGRYDYE